MLIDTNIFLELFLKQRKMESCRIFLNGTIEGKVKAFVSDFTIDSVLLSMSRNNLRISDMKNFIQKLVNSKGIIIYSINVRDRLKALSLMDKYKLDYEDAVILQSALSANCKKIISFDKHFDKVKEIERIKPSQLE